MVWVQLALLPIVYLMMWAVEGKPMYGDVAGDL